MSRDRPAPEEFPAQTLEGVIERIVYSNEETAWTVAMLDCGSAGPVTAVGVMAGVVEGDHVRLTGRWRRDPRFGEQFAVETARLVAPTTSAGIKKYLASGCFPGVGEAVAARLVECFGEATLEVIGQRPERLLEVPGIGPKRAEALHDAWVERFGMHDTMVFLQGHGVSAARALKIYRRYGAEAAKVVRSNPYRLVLEIDGIGFAEADRIAVTLGFSPSCPERLQAVLLHALERLAEEGHVCYPRSHLVAYTSRHFAAPPDLFEEALENLARRERVVVESGEEGEMIFLPALYVAETGGAEALQRILRTPAGAAGLDAEDAISFLEAQAAVELAERQRQALRDAVFCKALVVTGGPGTGKTTIVKGIVRMFDRAGLKCALAAPTGRAARRLAEATGHPASTIHRLLEFSPRDGVFLRDESNPIDADVLVVDEASMIDCLLFSSLLRALPPVCRLIMVGDADQLPSVGPGSVLRDIIASEAVKVVCLEEIFRQAQRSLIVRNAHLVNRGEMPREESDSQAADFFFVEREDPQAALDTLKTLVTRRIPERFGLDPTKDVQVLSPMHRGLLGTLNLNRELRTLLNPGAPAVGFSGRVFACGDKVMQTRNNYELEIFNGDIGWVLGAEAEGGKLVAELDGRVVRLGPEQADDLALAYCCSVHKAQGSEFAAVVLVLHRQHYPMLQRNLLYTAITRGRKLVVVLGSRKALAMAVKNDRIAGRFTRLRERLRSGGDSR